MIKTLNKTMKQDKERYVVPRKVQHTIPIRTIWPDGIFRVGNKFSMSFRFSDINYAVASREDKESMFLCYSELLNSLDTGATSKITLNNRRINRAEFEKSILIPEKGDGLDVYRREYNTMLMDKAMGANSIVQDKYITVSVAKKSIEEARTYFKRITTDLTAHFSDLGSTCDPLDAKERLRIFYDFYRTGEEADFHFDLSAMAKKGHDYKDYICPDCMEFEKDHFKMGEKYGRVIYLKEYASYIKDSMITELTDIGRNLMCSLDLIPIPTDEAVREVENRLLGVETNITNWQRRQNQSNNFSAVVPYDMEQQRKESKEFLDDLTVRDQRMMFGLLTLVHVADSKEQLDADTEELLAIGRKHLCQFAVLHYQQLDGLQTALPYGVRKINALRTLTTESAAVLIPFRAQEVMDKGGIYCGVNSISHNLILCNRAMLLNPSAFILGVPGSGKSMTAKMFIIFLALATDDHILVYDPEGEYQPLIEALRGVSLSIMAGGNIHLNAMDMNAGYGEKNPIIEKSEFVLSLYERVADGDRLGPKQKSIIDRCVGSVYEQYKAGGPLPRLPVLRQTLQAQPEPEAQELALMLEIFTDGSLNTFSFPTNVDINNRIVSFNMRNIGEQLKDLGQLMITDHMLNRVAANHAKGIRTHIFLDEFQTMLAHPYSAAFFDSAYRRFRKLDGWVNGLTQNVEYVLDSLAARTMLGNSEFVVMLNQATSDRNKLAELLHISKQQLSYVTNARAGNGLLRIGSAIVPFINQFPRETQLYKLMTTKPGE